MSNLHQLPKYGRLNVSKQPAAWATQIVGASEILSIGPHPIVLTPEQSAEAGYYDRPLGVRVVSVGVKDIDELLLVPADWLQNEPEVGGYLVRHQDGGLTYFNADDFAAMYERLDDQAPKNEIVSNLTSEEIANKLVEVPAPAMDALFEPESNQPAQDPSAKSLDIASIEQAKAAISDIKVVGDGDLFKVLAKASSAQQGWMKSSKAMEIPTLGCLVQVTTQQKNPDGTYSVAEALTFVPGARIVNDANGGRKLEAIQYSMAVMD